MQQLLVGIKMPFLTNVQKAGLVETSAWWSD